MEETSISDIVNITSGFIPRSDITASDNVLRIPQISVILTLIQGPRIASTGPWSSTGSPELRARGYYNGQPDKPKRVGLV